MNARSYFLNLFKEYRTPLLRFLLLILGLFIVFLSQAQTGNVCETPLQIAALPYSHTGNTATYGNDYEYGDVPPAVANPISSGSFAQNYLGAFDVVYAFTPSQDDYVDAFLLGNGDLSALWVFTGCPFESTLGWDLFYNDEEREVLTIPVLAGTTYYFVLSSYPNNPSYSYTFELLESPEFDCPELPNYIGNTCDDNNNMTINDIVTADCTCQGISIEGTASFLLPQSLVCGFRGGTVRFYTSGTDELILEKFMYSTNNSSVGYASDIPVGTYDMYVSMEGMLSIVFNSYTINTGSNSIAFPEVIVGDLNNNNSINVSDFSLFATTFGANVSDSNYNPLANINCDSNVNIVDLSLLSANFGAQGIQLP